jgi:hypothetical protein
MKPSLMSRAAAFTCLCMCALPLHAQESLWIGKWTLHREMSLLVGQTITIGRTATGYHFDFGAIAFDIGDDGAFYPTIPTRTTSIRPVGTNQWFRVHKTNDKETDHGTLTVTPDNRRLLIHTVTMTTEGQTNTSDEILDRIGTGSGLAGTWRSRSSGEGVTPTIIVTSLGQRQYRWTFPSEEQFFIFTADGKQVPLQGPHSAPNVTLAYSVTGASSMEWTEYIDGRPFVKGTDEVDGQKLTEESWSVQHPTDRQRAVYVRDAN